MDHRTEMTGGAARAGIALAGNILTDLVKNVDCYPKKGMLANITGVSRAVGGCVPNTAIDLAKIDPSLPLEAVGRIGNDEYGRYVLSELRRYGIGTGQISVSPTLPTSFSDVMSLPTGERTFFHARGANAEFCPGHVDLSRLNCRLLHIGYLLLLDQFDRPDSEHGTVMAGFLRSAQKLGIRTSIDAVSDSTADYRAVIVPALKYCDHVIVNEVECCAVWGIEPYDGNGKLRVGAIRRAMEQTARCGVTGKVIVHAKTAGFCLDAAAGTLTVVPSFIVPPEQIRGSVGAGDAFCAGCLYALYHSFSDREMLEFASAAAVTNLFAENSVDGLRSREEIMKIKERYQRFAYEEVCV